MIRILKNFIFVLTRFRTSSILNIFGLSVAFSVFILIMMQLEYEYKYDRMYKHSNTIFRVEQVFNDKKTGQVVFSRPLADEFIKSSPHILAGSINGSGAWSATFIVETNGTRNSYKESVEDVYPEYTNVMEFNLT